MLVLRRKFGQPIVLLSPDGHRTVISIMPPDNADRICDVKLSIDTPAEIRVWRAEIEPGSKSR